jgi:hypothetical protein
VTETASRAQAGGYAVTSYFRPDPIRYGADEKARWSHLSRRSPSPAASALGPAHSRGAVRWRRRRVLDVAFLEEATGGEELTTIAWCWAALLKLEIEPEDIFHGTAYKGGDSSMIIDTTRKGTYIGFPLLQAWDGVRREERVGARRRAVASHGSVASRVAEDVNRYLHVNSYVQT